MTESEIERQRKAWTIQVRRKSVEKIKRMKMTRAVPMTLPQFCLYLWGDNTKTFPPVPDQARPTGGSDAAPTTQHQAAV